MNYREVYDIAMPMSKREAESKNYWVVYVVRPLSVWLTIPFVNTTVKPTTITLVSVYVSLIGFFLLAFGNSMLVSLLGWLFFFLWAVLDGVDGNLARCQKSCSKQGELWDAFGGYTTLVLIYMAVGIAAFYDDNIIRLFDNYWCLILGGLTSVLSIFPRLILQKKKAIEGETKSVKSLAEKKDFGLVQTIALNLLSCSGAMQVVVLLAILTQTLNLFILLYFVLNFGMTALSLKRMLND